MDPDPQSCWIRLNLYPDPQHWFKKCVFLFIESLSLCLPVLQMFSKLSKQMREKKYHPALKTLEQLESTHLPRIANYRSALLHIIGIRWRTPLPQYFLFNPWQKKVLWIRLNLIRIWILARHIASAKSVPDTSQDLKTFNLIYDCRPHPSQTTKRRGIPVPVDIYCDVNSCIISI